MQKQSFQHIPLIYRPYDFPAEFPVLAFLGDCWKVTASSPEYLHFHNSLEIGCCISGQGSIFLLNGTTLSYRAGDFSMIFPQTPHTSTCSCGESRWEYLYIDPKNLLEKSGVDGYNLWQVFYMLQRLPFIISQKDFPNMYNYLKLIFQEFHRKDELYKKTLHGYLMALLVELNRAALSLQPAGSLPVQGSHAYLNNALSYIYAHYAGPLSIRTLSAHCCISESHFRRLFKEVVGISPLEYIQHYRIQQACQLIHENREPLNLIARRVGYTSLSSFNRQFQQYMNCSPTAWRREHLSTPHHHEVHSYEDDIFQI